MPLSKIQIEVLKLLASQRDPESYVAGSTPLNRHTVRYSGDIDVFHDREERVAIAALADAQILEAAGYEVRWMRRLPSIYSAALSREGEATHFEWVVDSDFRFFPTVRDATFGYVLHPVDIAANKAMAAVGRREVRDIVDLVTIHERVLPLGAVAWAAVEKSPGYSPENLLGEIRRNSHYSPAEWRSLIGSEPIEPGIILAKLRAALEDAEAFVSRMPTAKAGLLFLEKERVVQPDPERLNSYETHAGKTRGHWPSSGEISTAMLERYVRGNDSAE